jgi:hypothetical protein
MATSQLNIFAECSTGVTTAITMCAHPNIHRSSSNIIFISIGQKLLPKLGKQCKKLVVGKSW